MTEPLDDPSDGETGARRLRWLRRSVWVVLLAGVVAFLVEGANDPPDPYLAPEETGAEAASPLPPLGTEEESAGADDADAASSTTASVPPAASTTMPMPLDEPSSSSSGPSAMTGPAPLTPTPTPAPPPSPAPPSRRPLAGFGEVTFRITHPNGTVTDGVALLADDGASRSQGLMEQTDLRGYDAMVFRFPLPSEGGFYMRNTRIPLSIAFFDAGGRFVSSADMQPCPDDVEDCPSYFAEGPYVHAIEVAQGDLPGLGIGPGSTLSFP